MDIELANSLLLITQVVLSITLIVLILLQHGKGADAGAAFGSGASATVFGARGSGNFLTKSTTFVAIAFFIVCLSLAYISSNRQAPDSVMDSVTSQGEVMTDSMSDDLPPSDDVGDSAVETDLPPAE